jgi:hypothetical protein
MIIAEQALPRPQIAALVALIIEQSDLRACIYQIGRRILAKGDNPSRK